MKTLDRVLVFLATIFWFVVGIFFTRSYLFTLLPLLGLVFLLIGGKKRV